MIYALHGMLGLPSDWSPFFHDACCPALFEEAPLPYEVWAKQFNARVDPNQSNILVGYSLGGRLGIHALLQDPQRWRGAILLSTGLNSRPDKWQKDLEWKEKFQTLPWERLMEEWNGQPVFADTFTPVRKESEFNRQHLSLSFQEWSTAKQKDLQTAFEALEIPIYWVIGEKDPIALRNVSLKHPFSKVLVCPGAGHRLQWDNPLFFKHIIEEFQHAYDRPLATH